MAHFQTLVLVSPNEPDPAQKADQLMARYFTSEMFGTEAKCDGYVIGGRYDGDIWGKVQNYNLFPDEFQARYGLDLIKGIDNICPVRKSAPVLFHLRSSHPMEHGWIAKV